MTNSLRVGAAAVLLSGLIAGSAHAANIVRYDMTGVYLSGWGGWTHDYDGTIVPTGPGGGGANLANYSGGSGTLNDGVVVRSNLNNLLLGYQSPGSITLHLGAAERIDTIGFFEVLSSGHPFYAPLSSVTVTINGQSVTMPGQLINTNIDIDGTPTNVDVHFLDIAATSLAGQVASTILLSGFVHPQPHFTFMEASVNGDITGQTLDEPSAGVPVPGLAGLLAAGLLLIRRYRPLPGAVEK